jgi:hypothetical protein
LVGEEGNLAKMVANREFGKGEVFLVPETLEGEEMVAFDEDLHLAILDEVKRR